MTYFDRAADFNAQIAWSDFKVDKFCHLFPEVGQKQKFKKEDAGFVAHEPDDLF